MEEIVIRVGKGGKINLDVLGHKGPSCKDLTRKLEEALGTIDEARDKADMYEQNVEVEGEVSQGF